MDDNVVHIGDFSIARKLTNGYDVRTGKVCSHKHVTLDDHGEIVKCDKCGESVSAYWYLKLMAAEWGGAQEWRKHQEDQLRTDLEKGLTLQAAIKVEKAWRSRSTLPTCPHCYRGISAHDGFGGSGISKDMEQRRRLAEGQKPASLVKPLPEPRR